jgi:hypothetical protein
MFTSDIISGGYTDGGKRLIDGGKKIIDGTRADIEIGGHRFTPIDGQRADIGRGDYKVSCTI